MYSDTILDHFAHPRNVGVLEDADGVGRAENPVCGDTIELGLKIEDGRIADVRFKAYGCTVAIASSSMLTEMIKGKTVGEALTITREDVAAALGGLPKIKLGCSVLGPRSLRQALRGGVVSRVG
jgi:nitrogen fixation NifU-like protein